MSEDVMGSGSAMAAVRSRGVGPAAARSWGRVGITWVLGASLGLGLGLGLGAACHYPVHSIYTCITDEDCIEEGADGRCESNSFCTYPDASCPEGRRWHDRAAEDLADQCFSAGDLEPTGGGSGPGPGTTAGGGSTSMAPGSDGTTAASTGASTG